MGMVGCWVGHADLKVYNWVECTYDHQMFYVSQNVAISKPSAPLSDPEVLILHTAVKDPKSPFQNGDAHSHGRA